MYGKYICDIIKDFVQKMMISRSDRHLKFMSAQVLISFKVI